MGLNANPRECGTNSMYVGGCRCVPCTAAHATYQRGYMAQPQNRAADRVKRTAMREKIAAVKVAAGCVDCGYDHHDVALDFDHLPGTVKLFNISQGWGYAWEKVLIEMAKCEVVCANCHRIRTVSRQRGWV